MNIMLDLETMALEPRAAIVAIGARAFTDDGVVDNEAGGGFYWPVSLDSSVEHGGLVDPACVKWWMTQQPESRLEVAQAKMTLPDALGRFETWLDSMPGGVVDCLLWGNGADFDCACLAQAFRSCGMEVPWSHRQVRCYRTLAALFPEIQKVKPAIPHHARHDAACQAVHAAMILAEMKKVHQACPGTVVGACASERLIAVHLADGVDMTRFVPGRTVGVKPL